MDTVATLQKIVQTIRAGHKLEARKLLADVLKKDPRQAQAWYVLSYLVDKREQQIDCLQRTLKYAPNHKEAQARLQAIKAQVSYAQLALPIPNISDSPPQRVVHKIEENKPDYSPATRHSLHKGQVSDTHLPPSKPATAAHHQQSLSHNRIIKPHSYCLWQIDDDEVIQPPPDILQCLIDDIAKLPIITSPHQELWLGIQLQAGNRLRRIQAEWESTQGQVSFVGFLWQTLLTTWELLEEQSLHQQLTILNLEFWISELLSTRHNIYTMRHSRLYRLIHRLRQMAEQEVMQEILGLIYVVAEILAILPTQVLTNLIEYIGQYEQLPELMEVRDWLPDQAMLQEQVQQQVKQTVDVLTTGYLRYALRVAQGYVGQGLEYVDLVQAGFIGLFKAAAKFDYRVQARFGTYATSWIWQAIGREIADNSRAIRLPVHIYDDIRKWQVACEKYDDQTSNPIFDLTILFEADLLTSENYILLYDLYEIGAPFPEEADVLYQAAVARARKLQLYSLKPCSLSEIKVISHDNDLLDEIEGIEDVCVAPDSLPESMADLSLLRQFVEENIFSLLSTREIEVISLRYGWMDGQDRTLEEVGQIWGVTRERIRQIEAKVMDKLSTRIALGKLPDLFYLLPDDTLPIRWDTGIRAVSTNLPDINEWKSIPPKQLDVLLAQLPRSHWHERSQVVPKGSRRGQLVATLEDLAGPSHVADIAEQLNGRIDNKQLDQTQVYNLLMQDDKTFILLGQGIFSLVTWERARAKEQQPVLPCCPMPLPDPPDYEDAFFESVLVGQQVLQKGLTAVQFIRSMLNWAKVETVSQNWFLQTVLSAYYLVDLVPYVFYFGGENPMLSCTLPAADVQTLRYHCLKTLTERLVAMPEFWWLLQQHQPARPTDLAELFADIHPYGLDDVLQRMRLLASLGAAQKLKYGEYRLTSVGEKCANRWKREVVVATAVATEINNSNFDDYFANFIVW